MALVADLLLRIAECLLMPRFSAATGGSNTTLVDSTLDEPDELFDGGTIWFITGANAGKTTRVTSWDLPSGTFTLPAQAAPIAAGDQYAALDARYPRDQLVGALNQALKELGPFDAKNEALTTIEQQSEYALPAGVRNVKRLQYAIETVAPFHYAPPDHWWIERDGKLYLSPGYLWPAGVNMRLWYEAPHPRVYADADLVTDAIHPQRIAWTAALAAVRARLNRGDTTDKATEELKKECERQAMAMQREHPIQRMPKDPHWNDLP